MAERIDLSEEKGGKVIALDRGRLHRVLGARQLFSIGYGDVSSSIYYALGLTTLYALGAAPLALALAGLVFFCTVLTYTELASAIQEPGGSCAFARRAFNDVVSFIDGWALLLDYIVTIAISAYTIGPYLSHFLPILKTGLGNIPFTLLIIGALYLLNVIGIKESTRVSFTIVVFSIATQATIIIIGAYFLFNIPHVISHLRIGIPNVDWSPTWPQFFKGVAMAMVAYIGIESMAQLGGETRQAGKKIPIAMFSTMILLLVMYFGISVLALSAMDPVELSTTYLEDPLAGIVKALPVGQAFFTPLIGILGAVVLFVAANSGMIGASRLTFAMSENFQLPRFLYRLHSRFKTPYVALGVFALIAGIVVILARNLTFIAELYSFGAMISFSLAHLSLIRLRYREPELKRPYRIPWNIRIRGTEIPISALFGFLCTASVWVLVVVTKPAGRNVGFIWMGLGLALYFTYRHKQHIPVAKKVEIEKLKIPGFKRLTFKSILIPVRGERFEENVNIACQIAKENKATVTVLHVIEIPPALPLDTFLPEKLSQGDEILHRCSAIAREYEIPVEMEVQQSRFAGATIVDLAQEKGHDLILMGAQTGKKKSMTGFGRTIDHVIRKAHCRVWLCSGAAIHKTVKTHGSSKGTPQAT